MHSGRRGGLRIDNPWFSLERIDDETFALSEYGHWEGVHSYLLVGSKRAALVDTGLGVANIREIVEQLTQLPVTVLTTHVHWDHVGGHRLFEDIRVHALDADWLEHGIPVPLEAQRRDFMSQPFRSPPPADFSIERWQPFRGRPAHLLSDGDFLDLGGRMLTILHTPGHSPGHICIYEERRGYLITGDLVYRGELHAFYPSTDPIAFRASVHRLCALPHVTTLLPGHHDLNLDRSDLLAVAEALDVIHERGLLRHGTGRHHIGPVSIRL